MNCISYALFGYNESYSNCYDFKSYLRNLEINLRMNKILFPNWITHLTIDEDTAHSPYMELINYHVESGLLNLSIMPKTELCRMMLYRLIPVFLQDFDGIQKYDRVICRDTDSLCTYRERQAIEYWIKNGKVAHAITDSISHNVSLMGGMIGFQTNLLRKDLGVRQFEKMLELDTSIDFNKKGSDQTFLNKVILPKIAYSITEHYILGLPQSFRGDCFNYIQDDPVEDIPPLLRESNILVNHIGQAGFIVEPVLKFIDKYETDHEYFNNIERKFPEIFYWHLTEQMIIRE